MLHKSGHNLLPLSAPAPPSLPVPPAVPAPPTPPNPPHLLHLHNLLLLLLPPASNPAPPAPHAPPSPLQTLYSSCFPLLNLPCSSYSPPFSLPPRFSAPLPPPPAPSGSTPSSLPYVAANTCRPRLAGERDGVVVEGGTDKGGLGGGGGHTPHTTREPLPSSHGGWSLLVNSPRRRPSA